MVDDTEQKLLEVIAASDEVVAEEGGSADPVAQRRVFTALTRKARALRTLGRYGEAVSVWNELLRILADDPSSGPPLAALRVRSATAQVLLLAGQPGTALEEVDDGLVASCDEEDQSDAVNRLVAEVLVTRREALVRLGREDEALETNEETLRRFAEAESPMMRGRVNNALAFKSRALWRAGQAEDALEVSELMVERLAAEPVAGLRNSAAMVINDVMRLMSISGPKARGVFWFVLVVMIDSAYEGVRVATTRLPTDSIRLFSRPRLRPLAGTIQSLAVATVPERLITSRRRADQALAGIQVVIARLEGSDDPELQEMAAFARMEQGAALYVLGHPIDATRVLDPLVSGRQPGTAQAWQTLASTFAHGDDKMAGVGVVSALGLRAQALGAGDRKIAQIAYDDSLDDQGVTGRSTFVDLVARGLRPPAKRKRSR